MPARCCAAHGGSDPAGSEKQRWQAQPWGGDGMIHETRVVRAVRGGGLLLTLAISSALWAQFDTGTILGTVRDGSGAVVPSASMVLRNTATGITAASQTDDQGNYQFPNLRIGTYE